MTKHLTVEVQQELKKNPKSPAAAAQMAMVGVLHNNAGGNLQTFDSGDVLLSATEPKTHDRWELHVDNDDLAGEEDTLQLSLHAFHDGQEIDTPMQFISQIAVGMKRQENIWRLNEITITAMLPVGNPDFFAKVDEGHASTFSFYPPGTQEQNSPQERPKLDVETAVRMLAFSEEMYASQHPENGFTCSLSDLKPSSNQIPSFGLDPQVFTGNFSGYRFSLTGCQGNPAGSFQIVAEPASGAQGGKAFCTDATRNIRVADDGRGSTCLASGKTQSHWTGVDQ